MYNFKENGWSSDFVSDTSIEPYMYILLGETSHLKLNILGLAVHYKKKVLKLSNGD